MSACVLFYFGHYKGGGTFATGGVFYKTPPNFHAFIKHGMFDGKQKLLHNFRLFQKIFKGTQENKEKLTVFLVKIWLGETLVKIKPYLPFTFFRILPLQTGRCNLTGTEDRRECLL